MLALAGQIGLEPWGYTLSELTTMADGRQEERWWHTTSIVATLLNMYRKKGDLVDPIDLHPFYRREKRGLTLTDNFSAIEAAFCGLIPKES